MAKAGPLSVQQLRPCLLDLAAKQIELRTRLAAFRTESGATVGAVARQAEMPWQGLRNFIDGTQALSSGRGLTRLCQILQCPELGRQISALSAQIGDRNLALSNRPREVIITALDLVEYQRDRAGEYNMAEFAAAFGDDTACVQGVLNGSQDALIALDDEETRERITTALLEGLDQRLGGAKERLAAERRGAADRLAELVGPLAERAGGKSALTRLLGTSRSTLHYALAAEASLEQIERLVASAQRLQAMMQPETDATAPAVPESATAGYETKADAAEALTTLGGITTASGIEFVLTEESFRAIEKIPLVALREALLSAIKHLRLLLNTASQIADDTAREILQDAAAKELRELDTALKLFAFRYPSQLLPLYDNQRALWEAAQTSPSTRKAKS